MNKKAKEKITRLYYYRVEDNLSDRIFDVDLAHCNNTPEAMNMIALDIYLQNDHYKLRENWPLKVAVFNSQKAVNENHPTRMIKIDLNYFAPIFFGETIKTLKEKADDLQILEQIKNADWLK
jgi:hypothetical protein